jgi:iron complex outermembrane receptor protein
MVKSAIWVLLVVAMTLFRLSHHPVQAQERPRDLAEFSLEELLQLEVTSVSEKEQRLSESAAAIYVLTQEDIRRSGATSIPEALRMVPGLEVAQINASTWAISSRGFNFEFADKLLVLIDGRSVYTPSSAG